MDSSPRPIPRMLLNLGYRCRSVAHRLRRLVFRLAAGALLLGGVSTTLAQPLIGPFTPGHIGVLENQVALLNGIHPGSTEAFYDLFTFVVGGSGSFSALALNVADVDPSIPPSEHASLFVMALLDSTGTLLALDETPADGLVLGAALPSPGFYGVIVGGVGGGGLGLYAALIATEGVVPVDEPSTALLTGLGMLVLARVFRRRPDASVAREAAA